MSSSIGKNIKKFRLQIGISQDSLSKRAGLAFHTIAKIESGYTTSPKIETLQRISKALDVSLDELLKQHNV